MNIVDPILFQCRRQPPAAAICVPGPGIGLISYRRLEEFVHNISRRVSSLGLSPASIVAVHIDDVIFHVAVLLALTRLGMITISLRQGNLSVPIKIDALITATKPPFADTGKVILADLSWTEGDGQPLEAHRVPRTDESDICRIILTSGTINEPKAVALSHRLLAARVSRHLSVFGSRFGNCQRIHSDVPISSSLGFQSLVYVLARGGTIFFPGDDFSGTLRAIEEYKVECLVGSPGGFENFLRWFDAFPAYQSNIEVALCAGDLLSGSLSERLRGRICSHLISVYGSTEASMSATAHAHEIADKPRAVGFVTPGVAIQVVDSSGTMLGAGQEGYIRIRSEFAVDEYFRNPEGSTKIFRNGWFHPGDIGTLDRGGLLVISGREQTVLNLGGDKISPETVELAIRQFKGISEAAVFSAPNEYGNNEIYALVVSQEKVDEQKLRAHCEARLSRSFVPTRFFPAEAIAHNEMGKIDRRKLQERGLSAVGRRS
jgi:acyl-CoA synthetase (AMP-forming)/AMP-acid ligase II